MGALGMPLYIKHSGVIDKKCTFMTLTIIKDLDQIQPMKIFLNFSIYICKIIHHLFHVSSLPKSTIRN